MLIQSQSGDNYLTFDDVEHTYTLNGKLVPGGSSLPKMLPTPIFLRKWETGQGVAYAIEQLKLCPEPVAKLPQYLLDEIITKSKSAGQRVAKKAANIGSIVHEWAEADGNNNTARIAELDKIINEHPDREKILLCLREYKKWNLESGYETVDAEQVIASVKYGWGGKYDRFSLLKSKKIMIDFKTSSGIFLEHKVQVGGCYNQAMKEWRDIELDGIDLVRFGKDGSFEHELITRKSHLKELIEQAVVCKKTFDFMKEWEK